MTCAELSEKLGLSNIKGRRWYIQSTCATQGQGLYEGLDWLSGELAKWRESRRPKGVWGVWACVRAPLSVRARAFERACARPWACECARLSVRMLVFAISSQLSFFRGPYSKVLSEFPKVIITLEGFFFFSCVLSTLNTNSQSWMLLWKRLGFWKFVVI